MFYSQCLVSRKGPLGVIWVAAYFFKKLKKAQVNQTDIPSSVDNSRLKPGTTVERGQMSEKMQLLDKFLEFDNVIRLHRFYSPNELDAVAYRVLAYLLLGVVRIYSKKVDYLFNDCNKVLTGVKDFVIKEKDRAKKVKIALPERFELDAFDLGILEDFHGDNVKPPEDITLKEGEWQNERMGQYLMEKFDLEDYAPITFHETCSADHDEIEGEGSTRAMDIDVGNVRSVQKENAKMRETFIMVEEEPSNPIESSENYLSAHEHTADLVSDKMVEEVSWEKIQHDGFLMDKCISADKTNGVDRQASGKLQTDGEDINKVETVSEMCNDMENPSKLVESFEKPRGCSDEERMDFGMLYGTGKQTFEIAKPHQDEAQTDSKFGGSCDMTMSKDGNCQVDAKETSILLTPEARPQLKVPDASGETTPQFTVIPTPAAKEGARVSRKRKCLIDSTLILPNKILKQWIEDASELIRKRRKIPLTPLIAWRTRRFSNLSRCFFEPLIPYASLELRSLLLQGKLTSLESAITIEPVKPEVTETPTDTGTSEQMENAPPESMEFPSAVVNSELPEKKMVETRATVSIGEQTVNASDMVESHRASGTAKQAEIAPETVGTPKAAGTSEHVEIAPETPVRESTSIRIFKSPDSPGDKEVRPPSSFASFDEELETSSRDKDLDMILMDKRESELEREDSLDGWSGRTRVVARYLEKTFWNRRKRGDEEMVQLLQLCRGRTRKENARLFYETLVLKTQEYVDVKQDYPYGDVLLVQVTGQKQLVKQLLL